MEKAAVEARPSSGIVADRADGVEFECDGCHRIATQQRLRPTKSGLHFCGECSRDGTANVVRAQAKIEARRARVAELYPAMRPKAIADLLGVSHSLIRLDLEAIGAEKVPQWEPREHAVCALDGCDKPVRHDFASAVAGGRGRYCSRDHAYTARRQRALVTLTCKQCGRDFTVQKHRARRRGGFCSNECAGTYGLEQATRGGLLRSMHARGRLQGRRAQELLGKLGARKPPAAGGRKRGRPSISLEPETVARIEKLRRRGWGYRAIANELLLSPHAVRKHLGL